MRFKRAILKVSLINFKSTLGKSITNYISVVVLLVDDALQKELFIAPFLGRFKAVTPRRSP